MPYIRITGAEQLKWPSGQSVASAEDYMDWHKLQIITAGVSAVEYVSLPVVAWIQHGRWFSECIRCRSGMLTRPDWSVACCASCGSVYRHVVFPRQTADIERILLQRPVRANQNWLPHETVQQLIAENIEHGFHRSLR